MKRVQFPVLKKKKSEKLPEKPLGAYPTFCRIKILFFLSRSWQAALWTECSLNHGGRTFIACSVPVLITPVLHGAGRTFPLWNSCKTAENPVSKMLKIPIQKLMNWHLIWLKRSNNRCSGLGSSCESLISLVWLPIVHHSWFLFYIFIFRAHIGLSPW